MDAVDRRSASHDGQCPALVIVQAGWYGRADSAVGWRDGSRHAGRRSGGYLRRMESVRTKPTLRRIFCSRSSSDVRCAWDFAFQRHPRSRSTLASSGKRRRAARGCRAEYFLDLATGVSVRDALNRLDTELLRNPGIREVRQKSWRAKREGRSQKTNRVREMGSGQSGRYRPGCEESDHGVRRSKAPRCESANAGCNSKRGLRFVATGAADRVRCYRVNLYNRFSSRSKDRTRRKS